MRLIASAGLALLTMLAVFGCQEQPATLQPAAPAPQTLQPTAVTQPSAITSTQPASAPTAGGTVMATVNGQPLYMSTLTDMLVHDYGMFFAQHMIANELVRQEIVKAGVTVTPADVQAEYDSVLKRALSELPPPDKREAMIENLVMQLNLTRQQADMIMYRNAMLTKLAVKQVKITDEDLHEEFGAVYGRRVTARHIQTASLKDAENVLKLFAEGKTSFADLARKYSTSPTARDGGLIPEINPKSTNVVPAVRDAALAMKKPGEVSPPIQTGTAFHILFIEKIDEPKDVKFEDVKAKLTDQVKDKQIRTLQTQILQKLITDAQKEGRIQIMDPILKGQADEQKATAGKTGQ